MNPGRILVVIGHPITGSFNHGLAHAYADAARAAGAEVRVVDLATEPVPAHPSTLADVRMPRDDRDAPLADEVAGYVADLTWADHVTILFPQWWGTYPAALKAWIDGVMLAGFAHRYHSSGKGWDKLLAGRTARIIATMDSPRWWSWLVYRDAGIRALKVATLWYCGLKVRRVSSIGAVRHRDRAALERFVAKVARLGTRDAAATARSRSDLPSPAPAPWRSPTGPGLGGTRNQTGLQASSSVG